MSNRLLSVFFLLFLFSLSLTIRAPPREHRKQLAGPPSEFASMAIPDPALASLRADSCMIPFRLTQTAPNTYTWTTTYPVDTSEQITVSILSPFKDDLSFFLKSPSSEKFEKVEKSMFDGPLSIGKSYASESFGIDGALVPSHSYAFFNPEIGNWEIIITSTKELIPPVPGTPQGYLILDNISPFKLDSHLNTYNLDVGNAIGVVVRMINDGLPEFAGDVSPPAIQNVINVANMIVHLPNGEEVIVKMHDDGAHYDSVAGDGIYGATITALESGSYVFQPFIEGITPDGRHFIRSVSHLVAVSDPFISLAGIAYSHYDSSSRIFSFDIDVDIEQSSVDIQNNPDSTVLCYAEVWGMDQSDLHYVPIAWIEAMVDPKEHEVLEMSVRLDLNEAWVAKAGAKPPFQLKNVVIQDRDTNSILSEVKEIYVESDGTSSLNLAKFYSNSNWKMYADSIVITEEMTTGPRPAMYKMNVTGSAAPGGKLMLIHGYCSGDIWDHTHFTNAVKFEDYKQSRSQDQFALLIKQYGEKLNLPSFGAIGHSQGGLASLHLKAYYWSGLDTATGGRLIQSVGSPYKGCSLAGNLADLGGLFGVGCKSNPDLAPNGAQLWLSKVPATPQNAVYYYTTQYDDSWFLAPACVTGSGLVMFSPNDGTCEAKFAQPDKGGNNMGLKKSFCHTTGMNYPPQTKDTVRNADMNSKAAR